MAANAGGRRGCVRPLRAQGRIVDGNMHTESLRTLAFRAKIDGVPVVLLRPDWGASNLFRGDRIYGGSYNELEAYLYFSRCPPIYSCAYRLQ